MAQQGTGRTTPKGTKSTLGEDDYVPQRSRKVVITAIIAAAAMIVPIVGSALYWIFW